MIITYPIQIPYTQGSQQRVVPDTLFNNSEILSGSFPMGKNRFWHGGVHIHPTDRATPIRAVADGELMAYRYDDVDATDVFFDKVPYSRSFVLLKHETELGQTTLGTSTLTFYSLYMHLQAWNEVKGKSSDQAVNFLKKLGAQHTRVDKEGNPMLDKHKRPIVVKAHVEAAAPTADGECHTGSGCARVQRGDILGYCGNIPDNLSTPSRGIHFEIFFSDVTFLDNAIKTLWGRCVLTRELIAHEELLTKKTLSVDPTKALNVDKNPSADGYKKITVDKHTYWVSDDQITNKDVDVPDPKNKKKTIKQAQHFANSKELQGYKKSPAKNEKILAKGAPIIPWLGPWLKAGEFRQETIEGKSWIQVYAPDVNRLYWAEKSTLHFTSDADWAQFHKLEEHGAFSTDGFIDDDGLQKLLDVYEKDRADKNVKGLADDEDKLRHLITKHPTEWSKLDIAKRFQRVTQDAFGPAKLKPDQFTKLSAHIERLSFWEQVPGLPSAKGVWHAHPVKFIAQLAKCMWLSKSELALIYPEKTGSGDAISHGTSDEVREEYREEINKCCFRYGVNSRLRLAHFFGQGAIESGSLTLMLEKASGTAYENNSALGNTQPGDGPKFKGRGFKQLTGRYNYAEYWVFKGWLKKGEDFDFGWERDPNKRFPKIDDPEKLVKHAYCIDAGCWYITIFRNGTVAAMDKDNVTAVTRAINGGENALPERTEFTNRIRKVLL